MKVCFRLLKDARAYWKYLMLAMFSIIGITLSQLYSPWVVRSLTAMATEGSPELASSALRMGFMLAVVYIFQGVCQFARSYITHYAAWHYVADLRVKVYDKLQKLSLKYYHDKQTGQLMSRILNDTSDIELVIAHAAPDLIINVLVFVSVAAVLFYINLKLAVISLITIPFLAALSVYYSKNVRPKFRVRQQVMGELYGTLQDNITGMKEIQAFNQQEREIASVSRLAREHAKSTLFALRASAIYHPIVQIVSSMGTVFVIGYGGYLASVGQVPIADIVAFVLYLGVFYQPITTMARVNEEVQTAIAGAERIFEVLDSEIDVKEPEKPLELPRTKGEIDFRDVSFSYIEGMPILSHINLHIKPGQIVALVGPTGVGKTTMISLINRFYDPTEGSLYIDGVDLKDVSLRSLRDNISIVLQEIFLFNGSVAENIAYGLQNASMEQIVEAAKTAKAHDFIQELDNGYETLIGERGIRLSGGQKQRLSIARAVLRNTPILILDEATASVDVETEKLIHEAMDVVMENRTTILIAHRLSTVKKADIILVMNEGVIEESGTHEELMAYGGLYARLAGIQYSLAEE